MFYDTLQPNYLLVYGHTALFGFLVFFFQCLGDLKLGNTHNHVKKINAKVSFLGPFANR